MNSIFNKFIGMTVALLFVLVLFVPVVDGINHSQTETTKHEIGYNPTDAYTQTWTGQRGNMALEYECVRGDYDPSTKEFEPNDLEGDYVQVPMDGAEVDQWMFAIGYSQNFYFSNSDTTFTYDGTARSITLDWTVTVGPINPGNTNMGKIMVTKSGGQPYMMYVPYNVYWTPPENPHDPPDWENELYTSAKYAFTPNENGGWIQVAWELLADSNTYYTNGEIYGYVDGVLSQFYLGNGTPQLDNMTLTVDHISEYVYSIEGTGTGVGKVFVPYSYTNPQYESDHNSIDSVSATFTPVRGDMVNGAFVPNADGAYIKVYEYNIINGDYQIGEGQKYYTIVNGTVTEYTAPSLQPSTIFTMGFSSDTPHVYHFTIYAPTSDTATVVVPYEAAWLETEYIEVIPMEGILIVVAIISCLMVGVSAVVTGGKF